MQEGKFKEVVLQIAEERRKPKGKGGRNRYTQMNAQFQRRAKRDKKAFLHGKLKETEENNRMEKTKSRSKQRGKILAKFRKETDKSSLEFE